MDAGAVLREVLREVGVAEDVDATAAEYLGSMCTDLLAEQTRDAGDWVAVMGPVLEDWIDADKAQEVCQKTVDKLFGDATEVPETAFPAVQAEPKPTSFGVGDACEARFWEDNQWYGARVIAVGNPPGTYSVVFTEYGNEEEVARSEIRLVGGGNKSAVAESQAQPAASTDSTEVAQGTDGEGLLVRLDKMHLGFMGGRLLLEDTDLHLRAGRSYGLVGANGAGKSTLLRRIAQKDMPGFPQKLRVVYVEHEVPMHHAL